MVLTVSPLLTFITAISPFPLHIGLLFSFPHNLHFILFISCFYFLFWFHFLTLICSFLSSFYTLYFLFTSMYLALCAPYSLAEVPPFYHWLPFSAYPHSSPVPIDAARTLPCPTCSYTYPKFSKSSLHTALMTKAGSSFEMLVNIYQTTWCNFQKKAISYFSC